MADMLRRLAGVALAAAALSACCSEGGREESRSNLGGPELPMPSTTRRIPVSAEALDGPWGGDARPAARAVRYASLDASPDPLPGAYSALSDAARGAGRSIARRGEQRRSLVAEEPPDSGDYRLMVIKSENLMILYRGSRIVRTFKVALGSNPGDKYYEGDRKTPEGLFTINRKAHDSARFGTHLNISYEQDRKPGRTGGKIYIHGLGPEFAYLGVGHWRDNWTAGCIAVTDAELAFLYRTVPVGTSIEIRA